MSWCALSPRKTFSPSPTAKCSYTYAVLQKKKGSLEYENFCDKVENNDERRKSSHLVELTAQLDQGQRREVALVTDGQRAVFHFVQVGHDHEQVLRFLHGQEAETGHVHTWQLQAMCAENWNKNHDEASHPQHLWSFWSQLPQPFPAEWCQSRRPDAGTKSAIVCTTRREI